MQQKILFVEDDDFNREVITEFLELRGYEVCALPNGLMFLPILADFQPNLILLDLKLPVIDGFTLMEKLHRTEWAQVPIIILSGLAFRNDQRQALKLGARRFLVKPTVLEEIGKAIEEELIT